MTECDLLRRAEAALLDFFDGEELADLIVRCCWRAGLVFAKELPRGLLVEVELAGHDGVVCECGTFP